MRTSLSWGALLGPWMVSTVAAQSPLHLLGSGEALPGAPGHTVEKIRRIECNDVGEFSVHVESTASGGIDVAWGSSGGAVAMIQHAQGSYHGMDQTDWDIYGMGLANGRQVAYGATIAGGDSSVWVDDKLIAREGTPGPRAGETWDSITGVRITTESAEPYFIAKVHSAITGANRIGAFLGTSPAPLFYGGETLPGAPGPLASDPIYFEDLHASAHGSHWVAGASLATHQDILIVDGSAHQIGGGAVREGAPLPPWIGTGDWGYLRGARTNEAGDVAFLSQSQRDDYAIVNGEVRYATGDVLGWRAVRHIDHIDMNEAGQVVVSGRFEDGIHFLAIEDQLVALQGQNIDLTGDGVPDAWGTLSSLANDSLRGYPRIGMDGVVIFVGLVDTAGTPGTLHDDSTHVFRVAPDFDLPVNYCAPKTSSEGCEAQMRFYGTPYEDGSGLFSIAAAGVSPDVIGLLGYSLGGKARTPFHGGTLCIAPPMRRTPPRLSNGTQATPCSRFFSMQFSQYLAAGSDPALTAGTEVFCQWFYRDEADPAGWGLSNAGHFVIQP